MVAIMLAVGGAYASNKFAPVYYLAGDSDCTGTINITPPCDPGEATPCTTDDEVPIPYSYRPNGLTSDCMDLFKD